MESSLFRKVLCTIGIHSYYEPTTWSSHIVSGERNEDGSWDISAGEEEKYVAQMCKHCGKMKRRNDLDPKDVEDYAT